jgi:ketosteroid isomerase-like protein
MSAHTAILQQIYDCFNSRDIDGVLAALADDVQWANAMEGGHALGLAAVRAYWTRQWALVSPHIRPVRFETLADGAVLALVEQSVFDLDGKPLQDQSFGLQDKLVGHRFRFQGNKVVRFDVEDATAQSGAAGNGP